MNQDGVRPPDCPFCDIVDSGESATHVVASGEEWLAFFPLSPATLGHTLIIPRVHAPDLWHLDQPVATALMNACIGVGQALEMALVPDGMNLITSAGRTAEQTVYHLHMHLVPRWTSDGFGHIWPIEGTPKEGDLDQAAEKVRAAIKERERGVQ